MKVLTMGLALAIATTPLVAQKGQPSGRAVRQADGPGAILRAQGEEGQTLDVVSVPAGFGDGRITERDARALASYCVWGFNQLLAAEGVGITLGADAESRMLEFWVYVWDEVDQETKQIISMADVIWTIVQHKWSSGSEQERALLVMQFAAIVEEVWGGLEQQTILYLAGQMAPQQYAMVVDQAIAAYNSSGRGGGGGGGAFSGSVDDLVNHTPNYDSDYVMNDGSGDIVYSDPS